ncbi:unnamed protein product, partial [Mesorhabditis belari]|uniref:Glucosylceramidase n=1 Tax=Mesorhabditis belari TaxID=2138241 RepID=A0AAF3EI93_9BILA
MERFWRFSIFFLLFLVTFARNPCRQRVYPDTATGAAIGCVCNASYCDDFDDVGNITKDAFVLFLSSRDGNRMDRIDYHFTAFPNVSDTITIDFGKRFQKVLGFGGAITDSVGVNLRKLSQATSDQLINQYYGKAGIGYRLTRTVVASADFSTHVYSYNDVDQDFDMKNFNLTQEDYLYKIPYIKQALSLSKANGIDLKLFCTAWAPPGWMKSNGKMEGGAKMKGSTDGPYYKAYATYYKRFFEEYHKEGIDYWGMTPTNEPLEGRNADYKFQVVNFEAEDERDFIKYHLGPMLQENDFTKNISLLIGDENRYAFPDFADTILGDPMAAPYVSGFAYHWYADEGIPPDVIDQTIQKHPGYINLYTEACAGWHDYELSPVMGDWGRADLYAHNIIEDMSHGVQGWVDWNLVLDSQGGPNWVQNFVDAPIIANFTADEFIKQPMFYILAHFSKFVLPDYTRIGFVSPDLNLEGLAFLSTDQTKRVVMLHNQDSQNGHSYTLQDTGNTLRFANLYLPPSSFTTLIYNM